MIKKRVFLLVLTGLLTLSSYGYSKKNISLQDITITAQKQEENHKDIPISLTVFDEYEIEDKGFRQFSDLANHSSNFTILEAGGTGMMSSYIRGIASDTGVESSNVGIYVDGIPYVNTFGNEIPIENIERIEILKGPQAVLYGKNSYAGAVNIISKKPENQFTGNVGVDFGTDNKRKYHLTLNTPIIENRLMVNGFVQHYEKDGYIENTTLGKEDNYKEDSFGKFNILFTPVDGLEISLISSFLDKDDGAPNWNSGTAEDRRKIGSNLQGKNETESLTNALKIDYDFGNLKFSSISTYKDLDNRTLYDADLSPADLMNLDADMDLDEYSQEIRFSGKTGCLGYLIGFYGDKMEKKRFLKMNNNPFQKYKTKSESLSAFANLDISFAKDFTLSLGSRIDRETLTLDDYLLKIDDENDYINFSPKVTLKYNLSKKTMTYATFSQGFKSGGYFMFAPTLEQRWVDKEKLTNYETGIKSYLTENLSLGASLFFMDIKDKQVTTHIDAYRSYVDNAANSESKGFELDLDYMINKQIKLYASIGYSDSKFKNFKDLKGDYSENKNPFSPKYTYSFGANYRNLMGIFASASVRGQDECYADKENNYKTTGYHIINAKIGYEKENFEIYLYSNNLADKEYDTRYSTNYFLSPPRETGIQVKYRF